MMAFLADQIDYLRVSLMSSLDLLWNIAYKAVPSFYLVFRRFLYDYVFDGPFDLFIISSIKELDLPWTFVYGFISDAFPFPPKDLSFGDCLSIDIKVEIFGTAGPLVYLKRVCHSVFEDKRGHFYGDRVFFHLCRLYQVVIHNTTFMFQIKFYVKKLFKNFPPHIFTFQKIFTIF